MKKRWILLWMLTPALLITGGLLLSGVLLGLSQSLGYMPIAGLHDFHFRSYRDIIFSSDFFRSLGFTLWISFTTTFLSMVFAIFTALVLRGNFVGKRIVMWIYQFPILIPHLVIGVGMLLLLSQSGLLARFGYLGGWIESPSDFPEWIYDSWGIGIILTYLWKEIPFIGLMAIAVLQSIGEDYESVARTLGANRWQTFWHVLLPLMIPALLPGSVIVFAFILGAFEVPYLLGSIDPAMLSVEAYRRYTDVELSSRPEAMAMSFLIAVLALILISIYQKLLASRYRS